MEPRDDIWRTDAPPPVAYPPPFSGPPPLRTPKRRRSRIWLIVVIVALVAAGLGGVAYWGWGLFSDQARDALNRNPVIQRHIGPITHMEVNFTETGDAEDDEVFAFDITGPKGSGTVTARFVTIDADTEEVASGVLRLSSGETHELRGTMTGTEHFQR